MTWNYRIVRSKNTSGDAAITGDQYCFSLREVYYNEVGEPHMMTENAIKFIGGEDEGSEGIVRALEMALSDAKRYPVLDEEEFDASAAVRRERDRDEEDCAALTAFEEPNAETIKAMREARVGKGKRFDSIEELMKDLKSDEDEPQQ